MKNVACLLICFVCLTVFQSQANAVFEDPISTLNCSSASHSPQLRLFELDRRLLGDFTDGFQKASVICDREATYLLNDTESKAFNFTCVGIWDLVVKGSAEKRGSVFRYTVQSDLVGNIYAKQLFGDSSAGRGLEVQGPRLDCKFFRAP